MGGGTDDVCTLGSVASIDGNRHVPYLNRNGSERNLNLNWWDNRWNANYRFAAVRNWLRAPLMAGFLIW